MIEAQCPYGEGFTCILGLRYAEDGDGNLVLIGQCECCEKATKPPPPNPLLQRITSLREALETITKMPHAGARHLAHEALEKDHKDEGRQ